MPRPGSGAIVESVSFGLTFDKLLIILVIAVFLIGPDRLPGYAAQLARLVKTLRGFADGAKDRLRDEMGPEFDEVDWRKLDPRQYDPRRIIREALLDDAAPAAPAEARVAERPEGDLPRVGLRAAAAQTRQRKARPLRRRVDVTLLRRDAAG